MFSYSYNAKWPFRVAKERGMSTVLDLIDGGWMHEIITQAAISQYPQLALEEAQAPLEYWEGLREEIELADRIVVNSAWSKKIWIEAGVPAAKLVEIPLVYERAESAVSVGLTQACLEDSAGSIQSSANPLATRHISQVTSGSRRLQALFLGSVNLTKGVGQLFDATRQLKNEPVEFIFAGPIGVRVPKDIGAMSHVRFLGPVDRTTAERLYRDSDVFLFPTLSDGFGLTQLEALGHGLPVIASTHCGQVVEDRVSGLVLADVTPEAIADAIMQLVRDRDLLARLKANARVPDKC
ncbi:MAG: glycosyltransferase family 4 protein, partial [Chthoniobacterales bacterium]